MSREMSFFVYLLEHYSAQKGRDPADVLHEWRRLEVDGFFYDMYEMYHAEALENAFADIDSMVATGKPAW